MYSFEKGLAKLTGEALLPSLVLQLSRTDLTVCSGSELRHFVVASKLILQAGRYLATTSCGLNWLVGGRVRSNHTLPDLHRPNLLYWLLRLSLPTAVSRKFPDRVPLARLHL